MEKSTVRETCHWLAALGGALALGLLAPAPVGAQLTDITQTPNAEEEGIRKSLEEQVGAGQGDAFTPDSSIYIIKRDPFRSIRRGRQLFQRKFTIAQGVGPRTADGTGFLDEDKSLGAGLADSCAACHGRPRGSAGFGGDVFTRPDSRDAPHLFGLGLQEMLADEITADLRRQRDDALKDAKRRGRPDVDRLWSKGIYFGKITAYPNGTVDTSDLEGVSEDLRVRPFFAEGGTISIREFVVGALNAEMGLESPDPLLLEASAGGRVVTPGGMVLDGSIDTIETTPVTGPGDDSDGDGVVNEIDPALVDHLEFYLLNYFKPGTGKLTHTTNWGEYRMRQFGCTSCHVQDLVIENDRRVADVETVYDRDRGIFNSLFATASGRFVESDDGSGFPTLKEPAGGEFVVRNIFTDFKRHDLGPDFWEREFDGTLTKAHMTEPLWGVASTPPYGHDGRSIDLESVILRHGGEAESAKRKFARAEGYEQYQLLEFLRTLVIFPPDDTASNLNPGDPGAPDFPQRGHGNIALGVLFNDPADVE
jgi:hypothetical protein